MYFSKLKDENKSLKAKWEIILHTESDESKSIRRKQIIENTLILNEHKLHLRMWQKRLRSMQQFREDIQLSLNKSLNLHFIHDAIVRP